MYSFLNLKGKENISFDEKFLIENLRKETFEVKDCFNKFSYQAIIFSAAILTFIFKEFSTQPYIALSAIPAIFLINIVIRIGIHKYSTANRNLGYELYLSRIENLKKNKKIYNDDYLILKSQNWEEILRAWRIVQPIIFGRIYLTENNYTQVIKYKRFILKRPFKILNSLDLNPITYKYFFSIKNIINTYYKNLNEKYYPWFDLRALTFDKSIKKPRYQGGSYLKEMFIVLNVIQYVFLSIFIFFIVNAILYNLKSETKVNYFIINTVSKNFMYFFNIGIYLFLLLFILFYMFVKQIIFKRRRLILENELLSIHSCSITWHAIVIAHLLALKNKNDYKHYTEELVIITKKMVKNKGDIFKIHEWIEKNHKKVFYHK